MPSVSVLSTALGKVNISSNGSVLVGAAQQTVAIVEHLLSTASSNLLASVNRTTRSANETKVNTVSFTSEYVKTTLSVISLPTFVNTNRTNATAGVSSVSVQIKIPLSSNTLQLELPRDFGGSNGIGAMVSVIQLSSVLVGLSQGKTEKNTSVASSISTPVLTSDVIAISLVSVSGNLSTSRPILPTFEASLGLSPSSIPAADLTRLQHNCSIGFKESVNVLCQTSHVWLNLTCTGKSAAKVRKACPVFRHVCTVLNLVDNSIASTDYCQTIMTGSESVLCRCGYNHNSKNSSFLTALNGKVSVAAVGSFASSQLDASTIVAVRPIVGDVAADSVVVFVTFGFLWMVGLVCMMVSYWSPQSTQVAPVSEPNPLREPPSQQVIELTRAYVMAVLPPSLCVEE
jgi:hypothetical protein